MALDTRFFEMDSQPASRIAEAIKARVEGDAGRVATDVSAFDEAGKGHLTFLNEDAKSDPARAADGAVIITTAELAKALPGGCTAIICENPRLGFAMAIGALVTEKARGQVTGDGKGMRGVALGRGAAIGENVEIGAGGQVGAGAVVSHGVAIGRNCRIGANAVLSHCRLGDDVCIGANAVIGGSGFGFEATRDGPVQLPHVGIVTIGDGSFVGPGSCVARGTVGRTSIGRGVMIDNLVHIAHNCRIGDRAALAAQVGMAGGAVIGEGAMLAGQVGVSLRVRVGNGAVVMGQSGVTKDVADNETVVGFPAEPAKRVWKQQAALRRMIASTLNRKDA